MNSILLEGFGNLLAVVPPIMISQDRINSERRFEVLQGGRGHLRLDSMAVPVIGNHVIACQQDQIRLLLIGQLNNSLQLPIVNEPRAGVHVADQRDAQSAELDGPIFYWHLFLMNDEAIRLDK